MNKYNAYLYVTMKKLYWLFLVVLGSYGTSFAQLARWNNITFDAADTLWQHVIIIDTVNYHHNQWQVGRPQKTEFDSAHSFANAIVTDTANAYAPNDTSVFYIGLPRRIESGWGAPWLHNFDFIYKLSTDTTSFALIDFSADSGKSWISLPDSLGFHQVEGDTLVCNDSNKWHYWHFDPYKLNYYHRPDSLLFRFTFISGSDTMSRDGWMIDDIHVEYMFEAVNEVQNDKKVTLYPNPVDDQLSIQSAEVITSISMCNMVGQVIYEHRYDAEHVHVNTSGFPPGMYFLKVNNGLVKKFVKQ